MQRTGGGQGPFPAVLHKTGREPALYGQDIAGFHPKGSDTYHQVLKGVVAQCLYWWQDKGGIVQLPLLHDGNVMPNLRIDWPTDGLELERGAIHLSGMATDRNGNLESVSVHALSEPWMDWVERWDDAVKAAFERSEHLGEARLGAGGRWTFTWIDPPPGEHQLVAFARDADGAVATSNVVRITAAVEAMTANRPWLESAP
jgi:hypothetical protein